MKWYLNNLKPALTFDDVQLVQKQFPEDSRSKVDLSTKFGKHTLKIPIIASNMPTVCGYNMAIKMAELGGLGIIHRFMPVAEQLKIAERFYRVYNGTGNPLAQSIGVMGKDKERYETLVKEQAADILCIDIAHGMQNQMVDSIKHLRNLGFEGTLIAGNVCTHEGAASLFRAGADIIKVGVGPGSVCTTRMKTGCGMPQLSAIDDCSAFSVIADGGIRKSGDAVKALAVGASAVMIGGMLAGTDCVPGWHPDLTEITYAGSASSHTKVNFGLPDENAEGIVKQVLTRPVGSTEGVIKYLKEGLVSGLSYNGSLNLQQHKENAEFVRVTSSGVTEATPHFSG